MFLFVGLGNPGSKYDQTRHNIGYMAVDAIAGRHSFSDYKKKFHGLIAEGVIGEEKVKILKPTTYMNKSGLSVAEAVSFYKIPLDQVIVWHDDLDLPFGKIRTKQGGGSGGHNGLKDIDRAIGKNYRRVRIGIDHPGDPDQVSDYVLKSFPKKEQDVIPSWMERLALYCNLLVTDQESLFMTRVIEDMK